MIYPITKAVSIALVSASICLSAINAYRDATCLHNPTGLGINVALIIFLACGIVSIIRYRRIK